MNVLNPHDEVSRVYVRIIDLNTALSRTVAASDGSPQDVSAVKTLCADIHHAERKAEALRARIQSGGEFSGGAVLGRYPAEPVNHIGGAAQALLEFHQGVGSGRFQPDNRKGPGGGVHVSTPVTEGK